jgi:hypothetical protein
MFDVLCLIVQSGLLSPMDFRQTLGINGMAGSQKNETTNRMRCELSTSPDSTMSGCATPQHHISDHNIVDVYCHLRWQQHELCLEWSCICTQHRYCLIRSKQHRSNKIHFNNIYYQRKPSIMQFAGPTFTHNGVYSVRTQDNKTLEAREQTVGSKNKLTSRITAWLRRWMHKYWLQIRTDPWFDRKVIESIKYNWLVS